MSTMFTVFPCLQSLLQGYETTCFETLTIPPPVELLQPVTRDPEPLTEEAAEEAGEGAEKEEAGPQLPALNPVELSDQEARTSLLGLVSTHCCWGAGVVKQMRRVQQRVRTMFQSL